MCENFEDLNIIFQQEPEEYMFCSNGGRVQSIDFRAPERRRVLVSKPFLL